MFQPIGDRPQWQTIYDHLAGMEIGETVTYETLAALLPDAPECSVRNAFYRAVQEVEDERKRTFDNVKGVGYRMVDAGEHERLARGQHRKAKRRLAAAWRKAHSADRSRLAPDQRRRLDAVEDHLGRQRDMISRLSARVERIDAGLKEARREHRTDAAVLSDRVDRLQALLERHGITADEPVTS